MRWVAMAGLAILSASCSTTAPRVQADGPVAGLWKNSVNGSDLNADVCVKTQTSFRDFFLDNQAPGAARCSDASFIAQEDGALLGQAYCTSSGRGFMVHIRVSGNMATSYGVQTVVAPLGTNVDFSNTPSVISTRAGEC